MKHVRVSFGALSILLVLLLNLLAAAPALHECFHADAGKADHQCAVAMFAHGKVDTSSMDVLMPIPATPIEFSPQILVSILSTLVATLPPGRGPPPFFFNS